MIRLAQSPVNSLGNEEFQMAHPDTDPAFPEYEPAGPPSEGDTPGGVEVPDQQPFEGDPNDGRAHDGAA